MRTNRYATRVNRHHTGDTRAAVEMPREAADSARALTDGQLTAIQTVMALLAEDDLGRGIAPSETEYCPACDDARPLPGFVLYDRTSGYAFVCNWCATEYEVAQMRGLVSDIGDFLRAKTASAAPAHRGQ